VHPGARAEDFPAADLVLSELDLAPAGVGLDAWAVVATMGHYDEDAAEAALAHPTLDVALVASARRAEAVREALAARGLDATTLARLRSPAGRVRGASQDEIALLALADLVTTRRRRAPLRVLEAARPVFATDPVCGMTVELPGRHHATVDGVKHWFCSAGCRETYVQAAATEAMPST